MKTQIEIETKLGVFYFKVGDFKKIMDNYSNPLVAFDLIERFQEDLVEFIHTNDPRFFIDKSYTARRNSVGMNALDFELTFHITNLRRATERNVVMQLEIPSDFFSLLTHFEYLTKSLVDAYVHV